MRASLLDKTKQDEINKFMELYDTVYSQVTLVTKTSRLPDDEFQKKVAKMENLKNLKLPTLPKDVKKVNYKKLNA